MIKRILEYALKSAFGEPDSMLFGEFDYGNWTDNACTIHFITCLQIKELVRYIYNDYDVNSL